MDYYAANESFSVNFCTSLQQYAKYYGLHILVLVFVFDKLSAPFVQEFVVRSNIVVAPHYRFLLCRILYNILVVEPLSSLSLCQ